MVKAEALTPVLRDGEADPFEFGFLNRQGYHLL